MDRGKRTIRSGNSIVFVAWAITILPRWTFNALSNQRPLIRPYILESLLVVVQLPLSAAAAHILRSSSSCVLVKPRQGSALIPPPFISHVYWAATASCVTKPASSHSYTTLFLPFCAVSLCEVDVIFLSLMMSPDCLCIQFYFSLSYCRLLRSILHPLWMAFTTAPVLSAGERNPPFSTLINSVRIDTTSIWGRFNPIVMKTGEEKKIK